jgi:hypothetical protein
LNKNKTKGLWLGAWKNRKDNYKFGIDFVECIKIVGFKIGNPIYHIFDVANTLTTRDFSNKDKCLNFHKFNTFSNFA